MNAKEILKELEPFGKPENVEGMRRFGISSDTAYGVPVPVPVLRNYAKKFKHDHKLALELWVTNVHEGKLLAAYIENPEEVTEEQMQIWVNDFYSWDICDQVCSNVFDKTLFAYDKAIEWCNEEKEFVRRAGFVMMAVLAVHDKKAGNDKFIQFFPFIEEYSDDERNFVKKAVNWALRQIGKRNLQLNARAITLANKIKKQNSKSARWIASDAIRELENEKVINRLKRK
ncbi:DNA alkylation repair protein [Bacteroidota bacterium]